MRIPLSGRSGRPPGPEPTKRTLAGERGLHGRGDRVVGAGRLTSFRRWRLPAPLFHFPPSLPSGRQSERLRSIILFSRTLGLVMTKPLLRIGLIAVLCALPRIAFASWP